jgi:hypothetical protein
LLLGGGYEIVCHHDIPHRRRGGTVLHPYIRDQQSFAIGDGELHGLS